MPRLGPPKRSFMGTKPGTKRAFYRDGSGPWHGDATRASYHARGPAGLKGKSTFYFLLPLLGTRQRLYGDTKVVQDRSYHRPRLFILPEDHSFL